MRARWLILVWLGLASAVWLGFYDILITRGTKEYFMQEALSRADGGPAPSLDRIMAETSHDARITASWWGALVLGTGGVTVFMARRRSS